MCFKSTTTTVIDSHHSKIYFIVRVFERVVEYLDARLDYIPLNFMLGFFVTIIVNRWTYLYQIIGFIDKLVSLSSFRIIRRNLW